MLPANASSTAGYAQSIRLRIGGALAWHERTRIAGGDPLLDSPVGLDGHHVFGCLWAAGAALETLDLDEIRAELGAAGDAAPLTRLAPRLLVARTLGGSTTPPVQRSLPSGARCGRACADCRRSRRACGRREHGNARWNSLRARRTSC